MPAFSLLSSSRSSGLRKSTFGGGCHTLFYHGVILFGQYSVVFLVTFSHLTTSSKEEKDSFVIGVFLFGRLSRPRKNTFSQRKACNFCCMVVFLGRPILLFFQGAAFSLLSFSRASGLQKSPLGSDAIHYFTTGVVFFRSV